METNGHLTKTEINFPQLEIASKLNESVFKVISADGLVGFQKAYLIANAARDLKALLTSEYMKPIMELQGNRLGFKTDKDNAQGYPEASVKNCLIEAVLTGVQPFGNQFNIIAGNCYITKEGFGYLLANFKGLSYEIIPELPRIKDNSAAIVMKIKWTLRGQISERSLDIPVKVNQYMGTDAVIGKATRKARAWLYNTLTGSEVADGDAYENDAKTTIIIDPIDKEKERVEYLLKDVVTIAELNALASQIPPKYQELYEAKKRELEQPSKPKFTPEINTDIVVCETIAEVNQVFDVHPELKDDKDFITAINNQKIFIGKKLKGEKV